MPKISIIIPLYNRSKELVKCLESIKQQTIISPPARGGVGGEGVEVIIVNDGSTDKIPSIIDSNIQLINQPNQGAPVARNNGFAKSIGEYIIFCDADVVMKPDMLSKMLKVLDENPQVSFVYSSFKWGWKKFKLWPYSAERLKQMPYIHTTSLIRRAHFPGFDPAVKRLQDWDLWLTMLEQWHTGFWLDEILFQATGGTMSSWLPSFIAKLGLGKKAKNYQTAVDLIKKKHSIL